MPRSGIVAEAAAAVLAARLSQEIPGLGQDEIRRIARGQASDLAKAGWRITVPAAALPATVRRLKAERTTT